MIFCNLASGSKGNCSYIESNGTSIFVDVGISCKAVESAAQDIGIDLNRVSAIIITHEHIDHVRGIQVLSEKYNIPVYIHPKSYLMYVHKKIGQVKNLKLFTFDKEFYIENLSIKPFRLSHDAEYTQGFSVSDGEKRVVFATDLGYVTDNVFKTMGEADYVYIESNHDLDMLINGEYPPYLISRIKGKNGHLSNIDSAETIAKLFLEYNVHRFMLAHLSEKNNTEEKALETLYETLNKYGIDKNKLEIDIATQNKISRIIEV